ncbi:glycosyl transferase family 1, partial [candidate division KSB1 bacterium 4484_87]
TAIYFHENQICYPWSPDDRDVRQNRDRHYGFINYASALAADAIFFNSQFHQTAFFEELPRMLKHFPDHLGLENVEKLKNKSQVLHLGLDLARFDKFRVNEKPDKPLILWNHRWEYDKNPTDFFNALYVLHSEGLEFEVVVLGENFSQNPIEFDIARDKLGHKIIQFGYAQTFEDYARWLWRSDIIPVTSRQDFFGASTVEAIYCGCFPILPNRLSFPEIFSIQQYPDNFYNPFDELVDKLIWAVRNIGMVRSQNFKKAVEKYTWEQVAEHYDDILEKLTEISTRKID